MTKLDMFSLKREIVQNERDLDWWENWIRHFRFKKKGKASETGIFIVYAWVHEPV